MRGQCSIPLRAISRPVPTCTVRGVFHCSRASRSSTDCNRFGIGRYGACFPVQCRSQPPHPHRGNLLFAWTPSTRKGDLGGRIGFLLLLPPESLPPRTTVPRTRHGLAHYYSIWGEEKDQSPVPVFFFLLFFLGRSTRRPRGVDIRGKFVAVLPDSNEMPHTYVPAAVSTMTRNN